MSTMAEAVAFGWGDEAAAYQSWKEEVDQHIAEAVGVSSDGIPDWSYADAFEDRWPPLEAALAALAAAGWEDACQGCPDPSGRIRHYLCTFTGEAGERKVRYCESCAELAGVNFNGCTESIRPA